MLRFWDGWGADGLPGLSCMAQNIARGLKRCYPYADTMRVN